VVGLPGGRPAPRKRFRAPFLSALRRLQDVTRPILANLLLAAFFVYLLLRRFIGSHDPLELTV